MRAPAAVLLATVAALLLCSAQVSARVHLSEEDGESNTASGTVMMKGDERCELFSCVLHACSLLLVTL
jgi:hypothetical protein